ncbi:phosphatase PAP2 family protein [Oleiharenicola sp. Vm1]|uniref:phosphatase PAP2 family protein n=1 Tax=Oleiharenicola sp. Vm1 TaxID=3398393 RepID=UPI0039F631D6
MTPRAPEFLDRTLWPAVWLLAGTLALYEFTSVDLWLQDHCYDFVARRWIVDGNEPVGRAVFYNIPKIGVIVTGVTLLVLALGPARWRDRLRFDRRALWVAVATLATVPALAGLGKNVTNTFCPSEIRRYGGGVPYVKLCEPYPSDDRPAQRGHCFPAGHASGGFALLSLAWLWPSRRARIFGLALGLGVGLWMGIYQQLKGAHYLSHTTTTLLLAWIVMLVWRRVIVVRTPSDAPSAANA